MVNGPAVRVWKLSSWVLKYENWIAGMWVRSAD